MDRKLLGIVLDDVSDCEAIVLHEVGISAIPNLFGYRAAVV